MRKFSVCVALAVLGGAALTGCSNTARPPVYGTSSVGTAMPVPTNSQRGRILTVRDVLIKDTPRSTRTSSTGGALSTAVGVAMGSVSAIAGAVGDAVDGMNSGKAKSGEEITVELDNGQTIVIVQERGSLPLAPDERVLIQRGTGAPGSTGSTARVVREQQFAAGNSR